MEKNIKKGGKSKNKQLKEKQTEKTKKKQM